MVLPTVLKASRDRLRLACLRFRRGPIADGSTRVVVRCPDIPEVAVRSDDEDQALLCASHAIEAALASRGAVPDPTRRLYGLSRTRIAAALRQVIDAGQFDVEDLDAIQAGIAALEEGFDFADTVIAATNRRRGCAATATFDRKAASLDGFEAV